PWTRRRRSTPPRDVSPCVRSPAPQSAYRAPTVARANSTKGAIVSYPHPVFWDFGIVLALAVPGRSVRACVPLPVRPPNIYVPWDCPERSRTLRPCGNRTCVPTWCGSTHAHHGVPARPAPCRTDLFRTFRRRRSTPSPPCWPRTPTAAHYGPCLRGHRCTQAFCSTPRTYVPTCSSWPARTCSTGTVTHGCSDGS